MARRIVPALTITALALSGLACGRTIDDSLSEVEQAPAAAEDEFFVNWQSETEPPPAEHVYEADTDGCLRGVVWAESLTRDQVENGWCVDTLVIRVGTNGRFTMPTLEEVRGDLRIVGGGARYVELPGLKKVEGNLYIESSRRGDGYPEISGHIDLGGLRFVDKGIYIESGSVGQVHMINLEQVGNDLMVHSVRDLEELDLPHLHTVGGDLELTDTHVERLWAPRLEQAGQIVAQDNPNLSQCDLDALAAESESSMSASGNAVCAD